MIAGVYGLPGHGKTTFLAMAAWKWTHNKSFLGMRPSKIVFTNFDCPGCYKLDFNKLGLYNFCNCNIIIDEIMLLCDCRNFKNFPDHLRDFFTLHRRSHTNVLYCSQGWSDVDKKIRTLTEDYYLLERGKIFPFMSFVKPIHKKLGIGYDTDKYLIAPMVQWIPIFRPKWYKLFDSFESKLHSLPPVELIPWDSEQLSPHPPGRIEQQQQSP